MSFLAVICGILPLMLLKLHAQRPQLVLIEALIT